MMYEDEGKALYGATFEAASEDKKVNLAKAAHWLNKALDFYASGDQTKERMAFNVALKAEAEGLPL